MFKIFSKKQSLYFVPLLVLLFLIPTSQTSASLGSLFLKGASFLPMALASLGLQLVLLFASGIFFLASHLLTWAVHNPFSLSFTNPSSNLVIQIGWTLLRDMTNMLFVLGLAYIGLATAINKSNFNTKKIFGNIILIALLINFTPVICGVVVDVANIISNFFLASVNFNSMPEILNIYQGGVIEALKNISSATTLMKLVALIVYGYAGAFVLLVFTFIFFMRPIFIWILVIFSPLAFFAWIFEDTRKWFQQWWSQFLQWSFVGVPAGFFIYLSQQVLAHIGDFKTESIAGDPALAKMITQLAPYLSVVLFLIIGLIMSMKISAMGATSVISFASANGKKIKSWGLRKAGSISAGTAGAIGAGAALGLKGLVGQPKGTGVKGRIGRALKETARGTFTKKGREEGAKTALETLEKAHLIKAGTAALRSQERVARDVDEEKKRIARLPEHERNKILARVKNSPLKRDRTTAAALIALKAEAGFIDDEFKELTKKLQNVLDIKSIFKARPDWIPEFPDHADSIDLGVIKGLGKKDIQNIANNANEDIKKKIVDLLSIPGIRNKLIDEYSNLMKVGKKEAAKKLRDMMSEVSKQQKQGNMP